MQRKMFFGRKKQKPGRKPEEDLSPARIESLIRYNLRQLKEAGTFRITEELAASRQMSRVRDIEDWGTSE